MDWERKGRRKRRKKRRKSLFVLFFLSVNIRAGLSTMSTTGLNSLLFRKHLERRGNEGKKVDPTMGIHSLAEEMFVRIHPSNLSFIKLKLIKYHFT
jgi:hypothetical protein